MPPRKSYLRPKVASKKTFSTKIDPDLYEQLNTLDQRLERVAGAEPINRSEVVEDALRDVIEQTNKELDRYEKEGGAARSASARPPDAAAAAG